jgi:hypothetical protein
MARAMNHLNLPVKEFMISNLSSPEGRGDEHPCRNQTANIFVSRQGFKLRLKWETVRGKT